MKRDRDGMDTSLQKVQKRYNREFSSLLPHQPHHPLDHHVPDPPSYPLTAGKTLHPPAEAGGALTGVLSLGAGTAGNAVMLDPVSA